MLVFFIISLLIIPPLAGFIPIKFLISATAEPNNIRLNASLSLWGSTLIRLSLDVKNGRYYINKRVKTLRRRKKIKKRKSVFSLNVLGVYKGVKPYVCINYSSQNCEPYYIAIANGIASLLPNRIMLTVSKSQLSTANFKIYTKISLVQIFYVILSNTKLRKRSNYH